METYYHYTKPDSAESILSSRVIRKSTQKARGRRDDARYGSGVYLTKFPPSKAKRLIAFNNYDGVNVAQIKRILASGKVDAYIKLQLRPSDVKECEEEGRDIYLYPEQDLHIEPYMNAEMGVVDTK